MRFTPLALAMTAVAGLTVAAVSGGLLLAAPASADATGDWGPRGLTTTSSAVTVRWDNGGATPSVDRVPRDASQTLLHTAGKTYADVDPEVRDRFQAMLGTGSALGGATLSVSQTEGAVNQAVQVTVTGMAEGMDGANSTGSALQLMQCWGAMGADGVPDPAATQPDPSTCQYGAIGDGSTVWQRRILSGDPLVAGGDWVAYEKDTTLQLPAPFLSIDGRTSRAAGASDGEQNNPFFSAATSNELVLRPDTAGNAQALFELQTGQQSNALGCGLQPDAASVPSCWIVAVPRLPPAQAVGTSSLGAVAPSLWAQRMQVKIGFAPSGATCPGGASRTLGAGSEMLTSAMASWIPGACSAAKIATGFTRLGDEQVRAQLAGSGGLGFVSAPAPKSVAALYAPVALTAPVIAFTVDDAAGQSQLRDIKLDARLVAKLLTQSYLTAMDNVAGTELKKKAPWALKQPQWFTKDPEFIALNPGVEAVVNNASAADLFVENLRSDAAAQLWAWLLADPDAHAFLSGCPDDAGMVINPFFSSRTYVGCEAEKTTLDALAQAKIDATTVPSIYTYATPTYPPTGALFPQPGYYQRTSTTQEGNNHEKITVPGLTWSDLHARGDNMNVIGRNTFQANYPSNTVWCLTVNEPSCLPAPGIWKSAGKQAVGSRFVMSITDAGTAARFQLPTASLCDDSGANCVGATLASLTKAAAAFEPTAIAGVVGPGAADYAGGAYPLTMPVYAAVATTDLAATDANAYATLLDYVTGAGQTPGLDPGQLPPGYAPLTPQLTKQAAAVVAKLAAYRTPVSAQTPPVTTSASSTQVYVPQSVLPPVTVEQPAAQTAPPSSVAAAPVSGTTGKTEIGFPQFGLIGGLGTALAAGLAAPVFGRKRKLAAL